MFLNINGLYGFHKKELTRITRWLNLLNNLHFIEQALAVAKLIDDEEHIADIYCDATLQIVVEVDIAT